MIELDYETKFKQFILLFEKTKRERRTIGQCKATNGVKNFFLFS